MKIRNGVVSIGTAMSFLLAGSTKRAVGVVPYSFPRQAVSKVQIKPQPLLDSVKFNTIEYMDDGPILPRFINIK